MSELRQDIVSGDWIIMAPGRVKRPHDIIQKKSRRIPTSKETCPFEDLRKSGNLPLRLRYPVKGKWSIAVIRNKFPALRRDDRCAMAMRQGPYSYIEGIGHHDLVITRDHTKNFEALPLKEAVEVLVVMQRMYRRFKKDGCSKYVSAFANWGPTAGASVAHPHYQLLALPIIPPDIMHSLNGSRSYFAKNQRCVHCAMLLFEWEAGTRVVESNEFALAVAPFVSRKPFEARVYPTRHLPRFEDTPRRDLTGIAEALQSVLRRMKKFLNDPDFNFFIHTSPLEKDATYAHYHWHIEILPKISIPAGFELGTGIDVNTITPEEASAILKGGIIKNDDKII
ncbi:MAG: DUF4921 family protein [Patescibacteria group bacterium]|nr:DUF4921 family protein [Patescibacteria group bacterium]